MMLGKKVDKKTPKNRDASDPPPAPPPKISGNHFQRPTPI